VSKDNLVVMREHCPDCGRLKARNADDCVNGDCDKWYAVGDKEAREECAKWAYCKEIGADSIVGLDCCDNYKDWRDSLGT